MSGKKEHFAGKWSLLGAGLVLLMCASGASRLQAQKTPPKTIVVGQTMTMQGKFYCNIKALNPTERVHHKELTDKLIAARKDTVETEEGYEFQFTPANVSLAELADWVAAEGKCCPFLDFHIDLERRGNLLCLRLTGEKESSSSYVWSFKYQQNERQTIAAHGLCDGRQHAEASAHPWCRTVIGEEGARESNCSPPLKGYKSPNSLDDAEGPRILNVLDFARSMTVESGKRTEYHFTCGRSGAADSVLPHWGLQDAKK